MGRSEQFRPNSRSLPSARGQRSRIARARGIDAAISCPFRLLGVPNDQNGVFRDFRLLRSLADLVGRMRNTWDRRHPHRKENHHDDAQVSDRRPRGMRPLRTLSGHESGLGVGPSGMGAYHGQEGFKTLWSARFSTANACQLPPVKPQNRAISLAAHTSAATTKSPACPQDGVPPVRMGKACARPSTSTLSTRVTPAPSM